MTNNVEISRINNTQNVTTFLPTNNTRENTQNSNATSVNSNIAGAASSNTAVTY
jgi:hypothetical protein